MMHNVKTVFLDIDDTLWWFTENSKVAFAHVYNQHGLERLCSYERFHEVYIEKNRELWEAYHHGKIGKAYLNSERFRYTLAGTRSSTAATRATRWSWATSSTPTISTTW